MCVDVELGLPTLCCHLSWLCSPSLCPPCVCAEWGITTILFLPIFPTPLQHQLQTAAVSQTLKPAWGSGTSVSLCDANVGSALPTPTTRKVTCPHLCFPRSSSEWQERGHGPAQLVLAKETRNAFGKLRGGKKKKQKTSAFVWKDPNRK